jgi:GDP-4-dehydro-6-deoxy-D-mannose reductase
MRAVITGINGFVGRYLETELLRQHWQPFGISLEPPYNHNIFQGDLLDGASLKSAIDRAQPDVVFHLAGFTSVKESWKNPELAMKVNRDGTGNLFAPFATRNPALACS